MATQQQTINISLDTSQTVFIGLDASDTITFSLERSPTPIYAKLGKPTAVVKNQQKLYTQEHGKLTGLDKDDHPQYLTQSRGEIIFFTRKDLLCGALDTRYYTKPEVDDLVKNKAGVLKVADGGTGLNNIPPGSLLYGNLIGELSTLPNGAAGQILSTFGGSNSPRWINQSDIVSSGNVTRQLERFQNPSLLLAGSDFDISPLSYTDSIELINHFDIYLNGVLQYPSINNAFDYYPGSDGSKIKFSYNLKAGDIVQAIKWNVNGTTPPPTPTDTDLTLQMLATATITAGTFVDVFAPGASFNILQNNISASTAAFTLAADETYFRKNVQLYVNGQLMLLNEIADGSPSNYDFNRGLTNPSQIIFSFNINPNDVITILTDTN